VNANGDTMLTFALPDELVDVVVERVLARLGDRGEVDAGGYLDATGAAAFLACPKSRIYALVSAGRIPHSKDGSRLLFDPTELRRYVDAGGARRP
jgi:excisionase family DNA binding protein